MGKSEPAVGARMAPYSGGLISSHYSAPLQPATLAPAALGRDWGMAWGNTRAPIRPIVGENG
ncbi:hypothetical protein MPL3356_60081 [Mesorhizobium plurifarium]|uniref:Uncharacterized protein n=1 Tax=Mesorhizobium plurifarium TaxID=69974 RepID=A0A090E7R7_MESPL|nr:hypothetical protein MPL3356_60081 [Mesorhizobium plurifarium]